MTRASRLGPYGQPVELRRETHGAVAKPLAEHAGGVRLELETAPASLVHEPARELARLRRREGEHLSPVRRDRVDE